MAAEPSFVRVPAGSSRACPRKYHKNTSAQRLGFAVRASHSTDDKDRVYKQLGLFSLKKKIEDAILRAETLAPTALDLEEERWIKQEAMLRDYNLWDDPVKSNEVLVKLAGITKAVDSLKDLKYKVEEAKLITQLAEMDAIDYGLFKQAYTVSLDVSKCLHQYEMSKLLTEPYDMEGACMFIKAGYGSTYSEIWAEQLLSMYTKWAEKQGYGGRLVEKRLSISGGISSAIIEFEFEYAYGYLMGEKGVHQMIRSSLDGSHHEGSSATASVNVVPLFLGTSPEVQINDDDLIISFPSFGDKQSLTEQMVCIQHIPTGITVESSGERSCFTNKIKAINRLKAKLLVIADEQGVRDVESIRRDGIADPWQTEVRRYMSHPHKLVHDLKTGLQLPHLNSVLNGNIEALIGAHISTRRSSTDSI